MIYHIKQLTDASRTKFKIFEKVFPVLRKTGLNFFFVFFSSEQSERAVLLLLKSLQELSLKRKNSILLIPHLKFFWESNS